MVAVIGFILLILTTFSYAKLDARLWGTIATPGVLLISGYTLVAGIYALSSFFYEVKTVAYSTYLLLVFFAVLSVSASMGISIVFSGKKPNTKKIAIKPTCNPRIILIVISLVHLSLAIPAALKSGGLLSSESQKVLSHGIIGHTHVLLEFMLVYYAIKNADNRMTKLFLYTLAIISLVINPTKGWVLIPFFAAILAENLKKQNGRVNITDFIIFGVGAIFLFFSIYLVRHLEEELTFDVVLTQFEWIFRHFLFYITAGFFGLNEILLGLRLEGGFEVLFAPFVNIFAYITKDNYVQIISQDYVYGFYDLNIGSNVYSMIGSLIGYTDIFVGILLGWIIVILAYFLFAVSWNLNSSALRAGSLYINSIFAFGWFDYYFFLLTPYEILLISFVGFMIEKVRNNFITYENPHTIRP